MKKAFKHRNCMETKEINISQRENVKITVKMDIIDSLRNARAHMLEQGEPFFSAKTIILAFSNESSSPKSMKDMTVKIGKTIQGNKMLRDYSNPNDENLLSDNV